MTLNSDFGLISMKNWYYLGQYWSRLGPIRFSNTACTKTSIYFLLSYYDRFCGDKIEKIRGGHPQSIASRHPKWHYIVVKTVIFW